MTKAEEDRMRASHPPHAIHDTIPHKVTLDEATSIQHTLDLVESTRKEVFQELLLHLQDQKLDGGVEISLGALRGRISARMTEKEPDLDVTAFRRIHRTLWSTFTNPKSDEKEKKQMRDAIQAAVNLPPPAAERAFGEHRDAS